MVKKKTRRKKVSFTATKKVPKKVKVSFKTSSGKRVSFTATKKTPKKVKVEFYAKRKNEVEISIYLDTCILQGAISRRNTDDTIFMKNIKNKKWKVYTSIHTLMELYGVAKDRKFLMKSVIDKWVDVSTFLRDRRQMDLNRNDFNDIIENINNFFIQHDFDPFMNLDEEIWTTVKEIVENSNLHSSDALHLASAQLWGCYVLVTHDQFFIKEGNRLLKETETFDIKICDVPNIEKTISDVMKNRIS